MSEKGDRTAQYGASGAGIGMTVGGPWGAAIGGGIGAAYGSLTGHSTPADTEREYRSLFGNAAYEKWAAKNRVPLQPGGGGSQPGGGGHAGDPGSRLSNAEAMYGGAGPHNFLQNYDQYGNLANGFAGRQAPQAAGSAYAGQQAAFGGQLAREANGNGIGQQLIRQQAQGQADRGFQQQLSMAAGARPGQNAMATRQAMMNAGNMNAQVGGQSAQAAGQYQLGAMNNYGQFLSGARGQDQQQNQFNTDARLKQLGLNDQSQLDALRQRMQLQGLDMNDRTARYGIAAGSPTKSEQTAGMLTGLANAYAMSKGSGGGGGGSSGGAGGGYSGFSSNGSADFA